MFGAALVVGFAMGAMQFANMTLAINLVQHDVPEVMRGRVMSIQMTGLIGFVPIASLAGGALADQFGIPAVLSGAGACCLVFSLWALRWMKHVDATLEPSSPETVAAIGAVLEEEG
jgi:MFS family permease